MSPLSRRAYAAGVLDVVMVMLIAGFFTAAGALVVWLDWI